MSTKALKKELMAAVAMMLVAVIALSGSTFAWFAGNNVVTAKDMQVQAVAENGIEIAVKKDSYAETDFASVKPASNTAIVLLHPTSTKDASTWVHATAATSAEHTAAEGAYKVLDLKADGTENTPDPNPKQYYRLDEFAIRAVKGTSAPQYVGVKQIIVSNAAVNLDKALRVLIKCGDKVYNYNAGVGESNLEVVTAVDTDGNPETTAAAVYLDNNVASGLLTTCAAGSNTAAGAESVVQVYTYFEGEETAHFSNNLTDALKALSITVEFIADDSLNPAP